ncbi:amylovoran biosynthesis glycosyltransferase AmsE family protein [Bacteroidales bacterium KA00251]|nr:amylovoran biosynthesis glycosyltransferase AmsE family protein [Bacteroidales bacterium KA00251]
MVIHTMHEMIFSDSLFTSQVNVSCLFSSQEVQGLTGHAPEEEHVHLCEPSRELQCSKTSAEDFSVLMSVYYKESPTFFRASLKSLYEQTLPLSELIVVCDGPLTKELDEVLSDYQKLFKERMKVVRLEKNGGLGNALNIGMEHCSYGLVARMDSDDIAFPERFEKQIGFMSEHPEVDVLSSTLAEFNKDCSEVYSLRVLPEEHEALKRFAKWRSPANHPSVVFRKEKVIEAGGYQHFYLFEDYYLWVRMLMKGAHFHSLSEPLLYFRMNKEAFTRRKGKPYIQSEYKLQKAFLNMGFITRLQYIRNVIFRTLPRLLPTKWLMQFYHRFLRNSKSLQEKQSLPI